MNYRVILATLSLLLLASCGSRGGGWGDVDYSRVRGGGDNDSGYSLPSVISCVDDDLFFCK